MGKQVELDLYDVVSIPKEDAQEIADYLEAELKALKRDRWYHENVKKVERIAKLDLWVRLLKRLA